MKTYWIALLLLWLFVLVGCKPTKIAEPTVAKEFNSCVPMDEGYSIDQLSTMKKTHATVVRKYMFQLPTPSEKPLEQTNVVFQIMLKKPSGKVFSISGINPLAESYTKVESLVEGKDYVFPDVLATRLRGSKED